MISPESLPPWQLAILVPCIAFLYASVGFGGASGYLAAMSLFLIASSVMSSTALVLNLIVAGIAFRAYFRARHFVAGLLWPFLLTSVPAAFLGGFLHVGTQLYLSLLYMSLSLVTVRLLFSKESNRSQVEALRPPPVALAMICGAAIGLVSGVVGIGGGIFLAPLIVLSQWGTPKQAATSAAAFIFINSISGLFGRMASDQLQLGLLGIAMLPLGFLGAIGGSHLGARHFSGVAVRRLLGVVLLIAIGRFWLSQVA